MPQYLLAVQYDESDAESEEEPRERPARTARVTDDMRTAGRPAGCGARRAPPAPDVRETRPDRERNDTGHPPSYDAVRTKDALYVRYASGKQEYYDLRHDPDELHDLTGSGVPDRLPRTLDALRTCHSGAACRAAAGS